MIMTVAPTNTTSIRPTVIHTIPNTTGTTSIRTTIIHTIPSTTSFIASLTPSFIEHHNHHSSLTFVWLWQRRAQYIIIHFVLRCILLEGFINRECTFWRKIIDSLRSSRFCWAVLSVGKCTSHISTIAVPLGPHSPLVSSSLGCRAIKKPRFLSGSMVQRLWFLSHIGTWEYRTKRLVHRRFPVLSRIEPLFSACRSLSVIH